MSESYLPGQLLFLQSEHVREALDSNLQQLHGGLKVSAVLPQALGGRTRQSVSMLHPGSGQSEPCDSVASLPGSCALSSGPSLSHLHGV